MKYLQSGEASLLESQVGRKFLHDWFLATVSLRLLALLFTDDCKAQERRERDLISWSDTWRGRGQTWNINRNKYSEYLLHKVKPTLRFIINSFSSAVPSTSTGWINELSRIVRIWWSRRLRHSCQWSTLITVQPGGGLGCLMSDIRKSEWERSGAECVVGPGGHCSPRPGLMMACNMNQLNTQYAGIKYTPPHHHYHGTSTVQHHLHLFTTPPVGHVDDCITLLFNSLQNWWSEPARHMVIWQ